MGILGLELQPQQPDPSGSCMDQALTVSMLQRWNQGKVSTWQVFQSNVCWCKALGKARGTVQAANTSRMGASRHMPKGIKMYLDRSYNALGCLQLLTTPMTVIPQASASDLSPKRAPQMVSVHRTGLAEGCCCMCWPKQGRCWPQSHITHWHQFAPE